MSSSPSIQMNALLPQPPIYSLPSDILYIIVGHIENAADAFALLRTCRSLEAHIAPILHRFAPNTPGGMSSLQWACYGLHTSLVNTLLMTGSNPNQYFPTSSDRKAHDPCLHIAVRKNNLHCASALLRHGANIHAKDKLARCAIHLAATFAYDRPTSSEDWLPMIHLLRKGGANSKCGCRMQSTISKRAAFMFHQPRIGKIMEYAAGFTVEGESLMEQAARLGLAMTIETWGDRMELLS